MDANRTDRPRETDDNATTGDRDAGAVAIALTHGRGGAGPPKVVATGRGAVAEQILEIAFASGVKVRQDADLAEILASIDLDSEIPVEVFAAVAEILAYVYRANRALHAPDPEDWTSKGTIEP